MLVDGRDYGTDLVLHFDSTVCIDDQVAELSSLLALLYVAVTVLTVARAYRGKLGMIGTQHIVVKYDDRSLCMDTAVNHGYGICAGLEYVDLTRDHIIAYRYSLAALGNMEQFLYEQRAACKYTSTVCGNGNIRFYAERIGYLNGIFIGTVYVHGNTHLLICNTIKVDRIGEHLCIAGNDVYVCRIGRQGLIVSVDSNVEVVKYIIGLGAYAQQE